MINKVIGICDMDLPFDDFQQVGDFYKKLINLIKQMNYSPIDSKEFEQYEQALNEQLEQKTAVA